MPSVAEMSVPELLDDLERTLMHTMTTDKEAHARQLVRELDARSLTEKEQGRLVILKGLGAG